jgi:hypothetical protein
MKYEAFYLIEPRPALAEHLRGRVEPDFADVLLEAQLYRRTEYDRSMWFEPQRLAQAKLLFLASLREYDPIDDDAGFSAVFGSAAISVELFDRWFLIRRLGVDDDLDSLEGRLRAVIDRVVPPGIPLVDEWLLELHGPDAEPPFDPSAFRKT